MTRTHNKIELVLPEVFSNMTGEARISFDPGMRFAKVVMQIKNNFSTVTGVSLNLGEAGKNGEIVVQVEDFSADPITTRTFNAAEVINATEVNKVDTVVNIASLYQAVRDGRIKRGDLLLLEAFGGGFTWGSALIRY